jgi:hypothetical protein
VSTKATLWRLSSRRTRTKWCRRGESMRQVSPAKRNLMLERSLLSKTLQLWTLERCLRMLCLKTTTETILSVWHRIISTNSTRNRHRKTKIDQIINML